MASFTISPHLKGKKTPPDKLFYSTLRFILGVMLTVFSYSAFATDVAGRAYCDKDGDSNIDTGEDLSSIQVKLYNNTTNALLGTTTTNSTGNYTFTVANGIPIRVEIVYNGTTYTRTGTSPLSNFHIRSTSCSSACNCPNNALTNGSFELNSNGNTTGGTAGWSSSGGNFYSGTGYQVCGSYNAFLEATSTSARFWQNVNVTPGSTVTFSIWAGTHRPDLDHRIKLKFYNSSNTLLSSSEVQVDKDVDVGGTPLTQEYVLSGTAPTNASYLQIEGTADGDYIKVDLACLTITCPTITNANPSTTKTICPNTNVAFSANTTALGPTVTIEWVRFDVSVANPYTATGNGKTVLGSGTISGGSASLTSNNFPGVLGQVKTYYVYACLKGATANCQPFVSYQIEVIRPTVSATGGILKCVPATLTISSTGTITPTTGTTSAYSWTGPSSFTSITQNPSVSAAGTYTVTYSVTKNGVTCTATDTAIVTANKTAPNVNAGVDKTVTCTTTTVQLSGSSSTTGATYSWSGPAGATFSPSNTVANPTVSVAGTYTLTVTNPANGCTATDQAVVTENKTAPNVDAGADKVLTCTTASIQLSGSSTTAGVTYSWTGPAGATFTPNNTVANPTVSVAGTYTLTVTNPANGCTATDQAVVTENKTAPNVSAGADKVLTCTTTSVQLSGSSSTSGVTYSWTGPAGAVFTPNNTAASPTVSVVGTYTLTVTNPANGCTATDQAVVTENKTAPNVNAGADKILTCTTTSIQLSGSSTTAGVTYSWSGPAGATFSPNNTSATPTVSVAGTYTLTVTNPANGCTATDQVVVTENKTAPNVDAGADKVLTCTTLSVQLSGSSTTSGVTYSWSGPAGAIFTPNNTSATPTVSVAGTYTLTVTNPANGCTATDQVVVTENKTTPNVEAGADKVLTCTTLSVQLSGSSTTAGVTYSWSGPAGATFTPNNTSATPTVSVAGTYTLTVTNPANGCTATDQVVVTENKTTPNVNAGADKTLTCTTLSVQLSGNSSTSGVTYSWSGPAGATFSPSNTVANPTVSVAGTYILTVTNPANGCTATDQALVNENKTAPNVNAGADKVLTCTTLSIQLSGSSTTSGVTYSWSGPAGAIFTPNNTVASPTVSVAGTYTLTVTNPANGCTATDQAVVTENKTTPNVDAGADKILTCTTLSVQLSGSSTTSGVTYSWSGPAGATFTPNNTSATPTVSVAGTYTLTVTNPANGCTATDQVVVTENKTTPNVNAGADKVLTCTTLSVQLSGSSTTAGVTYSWSGPAGATFTPNNTSATPTVSVAGTYTLTVTNPANGCTATDQVVVTENKTTPNVNAGADKVLTCIATTVQLSGSSSTAGATFNWSGPAGATFSPSNTVANPTVSVVGTYTLTVTNPANGCTATDQAVVTENKTQPTVTVTGGVLTCSTLNLQLTANASSGVTYLWTGTGVNGQTTQSVTVSSEGTYNVTVTNIASGCTASDTAIVTKDVNRPSVTATGGAITCTNASVTINANAAPPGVNYSWSGPGGFSSTDPSITVTQVGVYTITVINPANNCTAADTAIVIENKTTPNVNAGTDKVLTCTTTSVELSGSSSTVGVTYSWSGPAGATFSPSNTVANPTVSIAGTYTLTVTNPANGCTASDQVVVTENKTTPNVDAGADKVLTCTTLSVQLSGSSTTSGVTYSWSGPAGAVFTPNNTSATPTVSVAGTYTLTVTNPANGCTATDQVVVTENKTAPNVNAGADKVLTCTTLSVQLSGSSTTAGVTYSWSGPAGAVFTPNNTSATPTVSVAGTYTLTVTNPANGCTATDQVVVTENKTTPNVNAGVNKVLTCTTLSVQLDGTSSTTGATFSWSGPAGATFTPNNTSATPTVSVAGTYTLTVTAPNGCTATDQVEVTENKTTPNVNAGADKVLTCTTSTAQLSGTSTTSGVTYSWSGPAGAVFTPNNTVSNPTVSIAGTYTLTVTNPINGCTATDQVVVTEDKNIPNVNAGADKVLTCTTLSVQLSGSSTTAGVTYSWSGPVGATFTPNNTSATPIVSVAGTYTLTVTNPTTGCTATDQVVVTENKTTPNVNAGADKVLTCTTLSVQLSGSSTTAGVTYSWSGPAGATFTPNNTSATPTVSVAGTYTLTVTNPANGCTATDQVVVTENKTTPNANAGADKVLTCTATTVQLSGSSSTAGATFSWSGPAGATFTPNNTVASPVVSIVGTYTLTVTNPANGCTATDEVVVTENKTAPNVNAGADKVLTCTATSVQLSGSSSSNNISYKWTGPAGAVFTPSDTVDHPSVSLAGTYILTVTHKVRGCTASGTVVVTQDNNKPSVTVTGGVLTCTTTSILLNANASAGVKFLWTGPGVTGDTTQSVVASAVGVYTLTVTNPSNGCIASDTANVTQDTTKPTVTATGGVLTCAQPTLSITAIPLPANGQYAYAWTGPNSFTSTDKVISADTAGVYTVTITNRANGCTALDTAIVTENKVVPTVSLDSLTLTCASPTQTLKAVVTNAGPNPTYAWTVPAGVTPPGNVSSLLVSTPGVYSVTVTNPANGCQAIATANVKADTNKVTVSLDSLTLTCASPTQTLKAVVTNAGLNSTYVWTVPAGVTPPGNVDSVLVSVAGAYSVTVTNPANGCQATASTLVKIDTAKVTVSLNPIKLSCAVSSDTLVATVVNGGTAPVFVWTVPAGAANPGNNPTAIVTIPGLYSVEVTNTLNGCKGTTSETVLSDTNRITVTLDKINLTCANPTDTLKAIVTNGGANLTYVWQVPQGVINPGNVANFVISVPGTYSVEVTNLLNGCKGTANTTVSADTSKPILEISERTCAVDFKFYSVKVISNGTITTTPPYTVTANGGGSFTISGVPAGQSVIVTATSSVSNCTTSLEVAAPDCNCPSITPPIGVSQTFCQGDTSAKLTVIVGVGETADWYDAETGGNLLASNTLSFKPAAAGTYWVQARKIDGTNCTSLRAPLSLTYNPNPTLVVSQQPKCTANQQTYGFTVTSNGTVTSSLGQVTDNLNGTFTVSSVPVNQDVVITATSDKTCQAKLTVKAPTCDCPPAKCVPYTVVKKKIAGINSNNIGGK